MIRTLTSIIVLLGALLLISKHVFQTSETGNTKIRRAAVETEPVDDLSQSRLTDEELARLLIEAPKETFEAAPRLATRTLYRQEVQYSADGRPLDPTRPMIIVDPRVYVVENEQLDETDPSATDEDISGDENPTEIEFTESEPADDESSTELNDSTNSEEEPAEESDATEEDSGLLEENAEPRSLVEMTPEMIERRDRIRQCLGYYAQQRENTRRRSPWGMMHTLITYGVDTEIEQGGPGGRRVNAIGWICWNGACGGQRLFTTNNSQLVARTGDGLQGHKGQFLAMLAQSRVPEDYPIRVNDLEFTVADLIEYEKRTCAPRSELTFKLIALSHYLDSDETWLDNRNREWSIERLIREELAQNVVGAACGGTHRMMGFSYAVHMRLKRKEPFTGEWERAREFVNAYHEYAFKLQNSDGSFSTNWFASRGDTRSMDRRMQTTGHILEWLVYSLPDDELIDPRVTESLDYLTTLMDNNREHTWEVGPKGHALHALVLYDRRVFGAPLSVAPRIVQGGDISAEGE